MTVLLRLRRRFAARRRAAEAEAAKGEGRQDFVLAARIWREAERMTKEHK